jgi:hypothetical protein
LSNEDNYTTESPAASSLGDAHSRGDGRILRSLSNIYRPSIAEESE